MAFIGIHLLEDVVVLKRTKFFVSPIRAVSSSPLWCGVPTECLLAWLWPSSHGWHKGWSPRGGPPNKPARPLVGLWWPHSENGCLLCQGLEQSLSPITEMAVSWWAIWSASGTFWSHIGPPCLVSTCKSSSWLTSARLATFSCRPLLCHSSSEFWAAAAWVGPCRYLAILDGTETSHHHHCLAEGENYLHIAWHFGGSPPGHDWWCIRGLSLDSNAISLSKPLPIHGSFHNNYDIVSNFA